MSTKKSSGPSGAGKPGKSREMVASIPVSGDEAKATALAELTLRPSVNAAVVITEYAKPLGEQDLGALVNTLSDGVKEVWAGDLRQPEAMLYAQAQALQAIFMNFARRAQSQQYQQHLESFLRMALKAQNQCRMTLETLATIKNPPVVIARQANINNGGQQQVNNGPVPPAANQNAHASETQPGQNKLLEATNGERLDTGAAGKAGGADPQMATVGAVDRASEPRRQSQNRTKR